MATFVFAKNDFIETSKFFVAKKIILYFENKKRFQKTTLITATINV
jgi:hypothetical protein